MKTLLNSQKLEKLIMLTQLSNYTCGNIVEVGVYQGGSAEAIAKHKNKQKKLFLFDTFTGMPESSIHDNYHKKGDFSNTDFELVTKEMKKFNHVFVYKGLFPQETGKNISKETFSLVHIDVDIYKSYLDCLEFLWPRVVKGGIVVLDDYNEKTCLGAKRAVNEFFSSKKETLIWPCYSQICVVKNSDAVFPIKFF